MRYEIAITMDNDAFKGGQGAEVARILRDLADDCERDGLAVETRLADVNGNKVGTADVCRTGKGER